MSFWVGVPARHYVRRVCGVFLHFFSRGNPKMDQYGIIFFWSLPFKKLVYSNPKIATWVEVSWWCLLPRSRGPPERTFSDWLFRDTREPDSYGVEVQTWIDPKSKQSSLEVVESYKFKVAVSNPSRKCSFGAPSYLLASEPTPILRRPPPIQPSHSQKFNFRALFSDCAFIGKRGTPSQWV